MRQCDQPGETIVFQHRGGIDRLIMEGLIAVAEAHAGLADDSIKVRKRLVTLLVEGLENLRLHGQQPSAPHGLAVLLDTGSGYRVWFGNATHAAKAEQLRHRIELLNEMTQDELKEHYLLLLAHQGRTVHGGAGLGLLTLARKSDGPLALHVLPQEAGAAGIVIEARLSRR